MQKKKDLSQTSFNYYGDKTVIRDIFQSWLNLNDKNKEEIQPQWVALVGETGTGKTRVIQEFFRYLSDTKYREEQDPSLSSKENYNPDGYWPKSLPTDPLMMYLNLDADTLDNIDTESIQDIPWLWWGLRGQEPLTRNTTTSVCAVRDALSHLTAHTALYTAKETNRQNNIKVVTKVGKVVLNQIPVLGPLLEALSEFGDTAEAGKSIIEKIFGKKGIDLREAYNKNQHQISDLCADTLLYLLNKRIPIILVLDDAQWFDPDTIKFIEKIVHQVKDQSLPLMILSTSWNSHWDDKNLDEDPLENRISSIKEIYNIFDGDKKCLFLDGFSDKETQDFLLDNFDYFSKLSNEDKKTIIDQADGNFRFLMELLKKIEDSFDFYFEEDLDNNRLALTSSGKKSISRLSIYNLIQNRFENLEKTSRDTLIQSSLQGRQFSHILTSKVVSKLSQINPELDIEKSLEATKKAENPGSIVRSTNTDLWRFLQGPYWHVVRENLHEDKKYELLLEAYERSLNNSDLEIPSFISEALAIQILEKETDSKKKIYWMVYLMQLAINDARYETGLNYLKEVIPLLYEHELKTDSIDQLITPDQGITIIRVFNQFIFGILDPDLRKKTINICNTIILYLLNPKIKSLLENKKNDNLFLNNNLLIWSEAIEKYYKGLGYSDHHYVALNQLTEIQKKLIKKDDSNLDLNFEHCINTFKVNEYHPYLLGNKKQINLLLNQSNQSDENIKDYENQLTQQRIKSIQSIDYYQSLPNPYNNLTLARGMITGIRFFPAQYSSQELLSSYSKSAELIADILFEIIDQLDESDFIDNYSYFFWETLFEAGAQIIELAYNNNYPISNSFINNLRYLSLKKFNLFKKINFIPLSLIEAIIDIELISSSIRFTPNYSFDSLKTVLTDPINEKNNHFELKPVLMQENKKEDPNLILESAQLMIKICREKNRLSSQIIELSAQITIFSLEQNLISDPETIFKSMLQDAALIQDDLYLMYGEPVKILPYLVNIYFNWLKELENADTLWSQLRSTYSSCEEKRFNQVVDMILSR